ncbi:MAG: hypothetical protein ACI8QC_003926 [Planctomycetota bacterium]|jgi:hypothetical protein
MTTLLSVFLAALAFIPAMNECSYTCAAIEDAPEETGTFPAGVTLTVIPGNSKPGGSDTLDPCDKCKACYQTYAVNYNTIGTSWIIAIENNRGATDLHVGAGTSNQTLDPHCGRGQDLLVAILGDAGPPIDIEYLITFYLDCECPN